MWIIGRNAEGNDSGTRSSFGFWKILDACQSATAVAHIGYAGMCGATAAVMTIKQEMWS